MEHYGHLEFGWQQKLRMTLGLLVLLWLDLALVPNAQAQIGFVKVLLLEGGGNNCQDTLGGGEFYFKGTIGNQPFTSSVKNIGSGAQIIIKLDVNQEFQAPVDLSQNISIHLEQWESDEAIYGKSIFTMIEKQFPSSDIRTLAGGDSKPYIAFFQKDRGGIQELIAADSASVISMSYDIKSSLSN